VIVICLLKLSVTEQKYSPQRQKCKLRRFVLHLNAYSGYEKEASDDGGFALGALIMNHIVHFHNGLRVFVV
jgi:hypothetical protein